MKCGICGNGYRSKATLVYVAEGGTLVRKRACHTCTGKGITVVPSAAVTQCKCGDPATTCGGCVSKKELAAKKAGADVATIARQLRGRAAGLKAGNVDPEQHSYIEGQVHALEGVAEFLGTGRWS